MAGKSNMVTIPRTYKSGPNSHKVTATYITDAEIGLLRALDMHNSGIGTENHYGPGGLLNMDGGDTLEDIYGKGKVPSSVLRLTAKARQPTRTFVAPKVPAKTKPAASVYAGPGYRTKPADLTKAAETRAAIAQYSPRAQEIKVKESRVGKVIPSGNGTKKNGEDPNGNGTKKTNGNGNGTKKTVKTVTTTSGTPGVGALGTGARQTYTGPTMLNPQWSVIGRQNLAPYMPPKGMLDYTPQASLVADRGRLYDMFAGGQRHRYSPPTGLNYIPQYAGRPESNVVENPEVVVEETPSYHDTYMDPTNPMGHYAALWRTGGQYGWDGNRWSYQPGGGPWYGVNKQPQPTSRTLSDLLRSLGGNKTTAKPNVSANATSTIVPTNVGGIFDY